MNFEAIYYNTLLFIIALFPMMIYPTNWGNKVIDAPRPIWGIFLIVFGTWCMYSFPIIVGSWTDRGAYAGTVLDFQSHGFSYDSQRGEVAFLIYTWIISRFTSYKGWFVVTAVIYMGSYWLAAKRMTREYSFILFLSIVCNFQFLSYGSNTIRAGFAASLLTLAISFCNKPKVMFLLFVSAFFCHKSMAIPIGALLVAYRFLDKSKWLLFVWLLSIVISYGFGSHFGAFVSGFVQDTRADYFIVNAAKTHYRVGFRWDFLLYSSIPVILGYWYMYFQNFKSEFYHWIYNTYLIANAFWVLVIRAEYTDRFAYLSWFLFPVLLFYPLLSQQLFRETALQKRAIVVTLWGQFAFAYFMFYAYNGYKFF